MTETIFPALYILAAAGFILAIKWMNSPATARRGVIVGEIGMLLAVVGTLLRHEVVNYRVDCNRVLCRFRYWRSARLLDADDRRSAADSLFARLRRSGIGLDRHRGILPPYASWICHDRARHSKPCWDFSPSPPVSMAFGKLQEILPTRPITYRGQNFVNLGVFGLAVAAGIALIISPEQTWLFPDLHRAFAGVRGDADRSNWGRRHANRDRSPQFVRRSVGKRYGFRARQQAADRRRSARWLIGFHPRRDHVPRHEPFLQQRPFWGVRHDSDECDKKHAQNVPSVPQRLKKRLKFWMPLAASLSFRVMAWRSLKRSTSFARCSMF